MGLLTKLSEWCSTGTKVAFPAGRVAEGWVTGQPPEAEYWNDRENKRDLLINDAVDAAESVRTAPPQADAGELAAGLQLHARWFEPAASPNYTASATVYRDSCIGKDSTTGKPLLIVALATNVVYPVAVWDYENDPTYGAAYAPTLASLDSILSVCCDNTDMYIAWTATAGNLKVSKFSLNWTGSAVWTVDTTIVASTISGETVKLIEANTDNVAVMFNITPAAVGNASIGIFNKTTGAFVYGKGNSAPADTITYPINAKIVSDGTSIFWVGYSSSGTEYELCAADIADPSTATPTRTQISTVSTAGVSLGLVCIGDYVLISTAGGYVLGFSVTDDDMKTFLTFTLPAPYEQATEHDLLIGFDGLNVWFYHLYEGSTVNAVGVRSVPASFFSRRVLGSYPRACDSTPIYFDISTLGFEVANALPVGKLLFDGRDLWFAARLGGLFRICNPGARAGW